MKALTLGYNTVTNLGKEITDEQTLLELLDSYKQFGVEAVEISHPQHLTPEVAENAAHRFKELGLIPWSLHLQITGGTSYETLYAPLVQNLEIGKILGARVAVLHPIPLVSGEHNFEFYRTVADMAVERGMRLALETGCSPDLRSDGKIDHLELIRLVDTLNHSNVGINIDTGHTFIYDKTPLPDVIRAVGKRLVTLHCHDNFGLRDDHQAPGVGLIDWSAVLTALREILYDGVFMIELTDGGKDKRALFANGGYKASSEYEILSSAAWIRYLWSKLNGSV